MKQRRRIYYSDAQKALMWDRWQKGESMNAIGRLFVGALAPLRFIWQRSFLRADRGEYALFDVEPDSEGLWLLYLPHVA